MQISLSRLAEALDALATSDRTTLTETESEIVLNRLSAGDAAGAVELCREAGWSCEVEDGSGMAVEPGEVAEEFSPFRMILPKPDGVSGPDRLVTLTGLDARLRQDAGTAVLHVVRCSVRFDTRSLRICPPDDLDPFQPNPVTGCPRKVVRETGDRRLTPVDVNPWLLASPETQPPSDAAFKVWSAIAAPLLLRCLANEVTPDRLVLRGPPSVTLAMPAGELPELGGADVFIGLQRAAAWVYETDRDLDTRHGLFTAEVARAAVSEREAAGVYGRLSASALASAKIAYGLVLSGVNRDTLKALADLRKAVSDETGKLADSTRSLAGLITTTLFAGIGIVLARLKADLPPSAMACLAVVLLLYVGSVIWGGWSFVQIQRDIRSQWRARLYSFLEPSEYADMVEKPVAKAERGFYLAARAGGAVAMLLCLSLIGLAVSEWDGQPKSQQGAGTTNAANPASVNPVPSLKPAMTQPAVTASPALPPKVMPTNSSRAQPGGG